MYHHGYSRSDKWLTWRVWAPHTHLVDLLVYSGTTPLKVTMNRGSDGWHSVQSEFVRSGTRYAFKLNGDHIRPDPASRWQPDGVHRSSALFFPEEHSWHDAEWKGIQRTDLVIYELHVGTFTHAGTFDAVIGRLPALRELGITAIELMPVSQFPGSRNWGYDGVHPFAVHNSYGGPSGLQRLVDACHSHGLALFLDVVYNHLGPEGNYVTEFGPYYDCNHPTPWGPALNIDGDTQAVRHFVLDNVRYWLRDFHVDGLRIDAAHTIIDNSTPHILRQIQQLADEEARLQNREIHIVAETSSNDVRLVESNAQTGFGLTAQWNDDFHHSIHALLTGETCGYYSKFGSHHQLVKTLNDNFAHSEAPTRHIDSSRFVVSIQNHDQIGNRPSGNRLGTIVTQEQLRLAAGVLLLSPFLPMLFMGEEYGEVQPFPYFCSFDDVDLIESIRAGRRNEFAGCHDETKAPDPQSERTFQSAHIRWNWTDNSREQKMRHWYRDLLALRRMLSSLTNHSDCLALWHDRMGRSSGSNILSTEFIDGLDNQSRHAQRQGVLELLRSAHSSLSGSRTAAYFNFSERSQDVTGTIVECVEAADCELLLSSEWPEYDGRRARDSHSLRRHSSWTLLPFEVMVFSVAPPKSRQ
ncbi:MAG: malto-oligosyltrehalose trehalohydrolase [Planctomycetaceae bacterium]